MIEDKDEDENKEMGYLEKSKLPYSLLLDPKTGRAAAYTSTHRLIAPLASPALVAFAQAHTSHSMPWDESKRDPSNKWRPLPDWVSDDVRARCVLIWIERGSAAPDAYWRSIPAK